MCVCAHVHVSVSGFPFMYVCRYVYVNVCVYACVFLCIYVCKGVCVHVRVGMSCVSVMCDFSGRCLENKSSSFLFPFCSLLLIFFLSKL